MKKSAIKRDEHGRIVKGSGAINPGGRPKGVAAMAAALSKDGEGREVLEFYYTVMRAEEQKVQDRLWAADKLADRLFGKAAQPITGADGKSPVQIEELRARLLQQPEELLQELADGLEKERATH